MAGIYLHIPFCKQACHYCDFHFSTNVSRKSEMVEAICRELEMKASSGNEPIETIYFGGGTPSLLSDSELTRIFQTIEKHFEIHSNAEITLEANPDDLSAEKIRQLSGTPINRLSIGIQSFYNEDLKFMNRAHNANEADRCVKHAQDIGLENITIDLIYAIPGLSSERWINNIQKAIALQVPHISSYCMTIEPKTVFGNREQKGLLQQSPDELSLEQYLILSNELKNSNFFHYEVSNFAKKGFESKHNTAYWNGVPYIGVGPSAHSFDGKNRRKWNISNNALYLKKIASNEPFFEEEVLSNSERYNETIMTGFRTAKGIDLNEISTKFEVNIKKEFSEEIGKYIRNQWMLLDGDNLRLTEEGFFRGDSISSDFFIVD
ncbi:MAG: radical SAM family heme chaperone HemW [Flavobacteriales bacterium]